MNSVVNSRVRLNALLLLEVYVTFWCTDVYTGRYLANCDTRNNALLSVFDLQKNAHILKKNNIWFCFIASGIP